MPRRTRLCFAALLFAVPALAAAQPYPQLPTGDLPTSVHLFAGGVGDGGPAINARVANPGGMYAEPSSGNIYIADDGNDRIRMIDKNGIITTVVGMGIRGPNREGQKATQAQLARPLGVFADTSGNVYVADTDNNKILKADTNGVLHVLAGTGERGFLGDGGLATHAKLNHPYSVATLPNGDVVFSDSGNYAIRKIDASGIITTIAGRGTVQGFSGDGGPANRALMHRCYGLTVDKNGDIILGDTGNNRIRKIHNGIIRTIAGNGLKSYGGDGGPALKAAMHYPTGITTDDVGNVYFVDYANHRVRKVDTSGRITTIAGSGYSGYSGDGGDPRRARLHGPWGIGRLGQTLVISDTLNNRIRSIALDTNKISTIAGTAAEGYYGDGGTALNARLFFPRQIACTSDGSIYIADTIDYRARRIDSRGIVSTIAGKKAGFSSGDGGNALNAELGTPFGIAHDRWGNTYVSEYTGSKIRKIDRRGYISTVAGTGLPGFSGDRGPAKNARLSAPTEIAVDYNGNVFFADTKNHRVRRIDTRGIITTIAGTGVPGQGGIEGPATRAQLYFPIGLTFGPDGTLYIADTGNSRIKRISRDGKIHVVAGNGQPGFSGDGGDALTASLYAPYAMTVAPDGTIFIADTLNNRIRKVATNGIITTIAGGGVRGLMADDGLPGQLAVFTQPSGICLKPDGTLILSDTLGSRLVRIVKPYNP